MLAERCIAGIDVHKKMLAVVVGRRMKQRCSLKERSLVPLQKIYTPYAIGSRRVGSKTW